MSSSPHRPPAAGPARSARDRWRRARGVHPAPRALAAATALGLLLLGGSPRAHAHGDDQLLIDALTEELAKAPEADLFIRRGELYRHHQQWDKAEADLVAAAKLDPALTLVDFFRARLLLDAGAPAKAEDFILRYLAAAPREAEGWYLRGEIAGALGRFDEAAAHYATGLGLAPSPRPDQYLRRARLLAAAPNADPRRVLAALDEGIAKLGPVISLLDYAIDLEVQAGQPDAALARIARAMENLPRRERWLVRQGDLLVTCGRSREAAASYRAALAAIAELPERYRDTVPMEKLAEQARLSLQQLPAH